MKYLYVYILECSDGTYYTGVTNDPERRLSEHNSDDFPESYTHSRRPLKMIFCEYFTDPLQAIEWEKRIKGWSHKKKKALIESDWNSLVEFSKRYKVKRYKRNKSR
jgi:putative endonuclease